MLTDRSRLVMTVGGATALAAGVYTTRFVQRFLSVLYFIYKQMIVLLLDGYALMLNIYQCLCMCMHSSIIRSLNLENLYFFLCEICMEYSMVQI